MRKCPTRDRSGVDIHGNHRNGEEVRAVVPQSETGTVCREGEARSWPSDIGIRRIDILSTWDTTGTSLIDEGSSCIREHENFIGISIFRHYRLSTKTHLIDLEGNGLIRCLECKLSIGSSRGRIDVV